MKFRIRYAITTLVLAAAALISCSEWVEPEAMDLDYVKGTNDSDYAALRAYKMSDHQITFGWFSEWTGQGAGLKNSLIGIPDSMDMVSIWIIAFQLDDARRKDLADVKRRGTRVLACVSDSDVGSYLTPEGEDRNTYWKIDEIGWEQASYNYGKAIGKWVLENGYDGVDYDFEPNYGHTGNLSSFPARVQKFIEGLAEYLGPKARGNGISPMAGGKVLMVDGEPQTLNAECGPLIDYYNIQAYSCTSYSNLDNRLRTLMNKFQSVESNDETISKLIWSENFEQYQNSAGPAYTDRDNTRTESLYGMARYYYPNNPEAKIAGVGAYRFNLHRSVNDYLVMRQVIQIMNPAAGTADE